MILQDSDIRHMTMMFKMTCNIPIQRNFNIAIKIIAFLKIGVYISEYYALNILKVKLLSVLIT